uniref:Serpentine receptor class gamma n=1 Tax=Haemonchus contortus TaxID=6289 RepID=A0A7I4YQM4_HAECO
MLNVPQTVAEVVIAIVYTTVILTIVTSKSKTFKNAFFKMFVATGSTDVISLWAAMFLRSNRELNLGPEYQLIVLFAVFVLSSTYISHIFGNLLIAINRFSALCLMQRYDKIWSRKNVRIVIAVQYLVSFLAFIHILILSLPCVQNADGTCTFKGVNKQADKISRCLFSGFSFIYTVVTLCVNLRMAFEWYRIAWSGSKPKVNEKGLILYTVIVFFFTMLMCAQQITCAIGLFTSDDKLYLLALMQFFWLNDVMLIIPPVSILLLSSELRDNVFNIFRRRKTEQGVINVAMFVSRTSFSHRKI